MQKSDCYVYLELLNEYFLPLFSKDERYREKLEAVRSMLIDPKSIIDTCFTLEDNTSVLNVGGGMQTLYKYDTDNVPCDVRFSVLRYCKYCTPVLDIGYILYSIFWRIKVLETSIGNTC